MSWFDFLLSLLFSNFLFALLDDRGRSGLLNFSHYSMVITKINLSTFIIYFFDSSHYKVNFIYFFSSFTSATKIFARIKLNPMLPIHAYEMIPSFIAIVFVIGIIMIARCFVSPLAEGKRLVGGMQESLIAS